MIAVPAQRPNASGLRPRRCPSGGNAEYGDDVEREDRRERIRDRRALRPDRGSRGGNRRAAADRSTDSDQRLRITPYAEQPAEHPSPTERDRQRPEHDRQRTPADPHDLLKRQPSSEYDDRELQQILRGEVVARSQLLATQRRHENPGQHPQHDPEHRPTHHRHQPPERHRHPRQHQHHSHPRQPPDDPSNPPTRRGIRRGGVRGRTDARGDCLRDLTSTCSMRLASRIKCTHI